MLKRSLRTAALLGIALVLAFFATGCDQFMSSALIYLQQNPPNYDKAIATLNEGLTVVPGHGEYYSLLALCYYENRQYKESSAACDSAIKYLPEKKDSLAKVRNQEWTDLYVPAMNAANRIAKAPADSVQFFVDKAQKALDNAVAFMPDKDQNYMLRAFILLKTGKDEEAKKVYTKVIEINPKNTEAYIALGYYAYNAGNYGQASELYKKALEINPSDTLTYSRLGSSCFAEGKYGAAADAYRKAAVLDPTNRIYLLQWATAIYNDNKNPAAAFEPLEKAAKLQEDEDVWNRIGMTAYRLSPPDYDRAMNAFEKAKAFNPTNVDYWKYLHDCYSAKKMKAELKEADRKIKELEKKK